MQEARAGYLLLYPYDWVNAKAKQVLESYKSITVKWILSPPFYKTFSLLLISVASRITSPRWSPENHIAHRSSLVIQTNQPNNSYSAQLPTLSLLVMPKKTMTMVGALLGAGATFVSCVRALPAVAPIEVKPHL